MSNIIKIKRSDTSPAAAPTALARGELAFQEVSNILYVGSGTETGGEAANRPVVAGPLNLMPVPTANVNLNSKRITNLAAPVSANDAARKADVDAAVQGLDVRDSVRLHLASPSANKTGTPTIDGVQSVAGDRVLVSGQGSANGIYVVASSAWSRATDINSNDDCSANMFFFVEEGTDYADTGWVCTTNEDVTLANLAFVQFSGTGQITAGDGIAKSGNTLSADLKANGGLVIESGKVALKLDASSITGSLPNTKVSGLGSLATLSAVGAAQITDNSVGAAELNISGNGTNGQYLITDGDGSFSYQTLPVSGGTGINVDSNYVLSIDNTVATLTGTQTLTNKTIDCGSF